MRLRSPLVVRGSATALAGPLFFVLTKVGHRSRLDCPLALPGEVGSCGDTTHLTSGDVLLQGFLFVVCFSWAMR